MTSISDAWQALRDVTRLIDKVEVTNQNVQTLAGELRGLSDRLVALETIVAERTSAATAPHSLPQPRTTHGD